MKYIEKLVDEKKVDFDVDPNGDIGKHYSKHFKERFSTMALNDELLPAIRCNECSKIFQIYKWSYKKNGVYTNSASNILNHAKCTKTTSSQTNLHTFVRHKLPPTLRNELCSLYAKLIAENPSISALSGTNIMNEIANFVIKIALQYDKNYIIDI